MSTPGPRLPVPPRAGQLAAAAVALVLALILGAFGVAAAAGPTRGGDWLAALGMLLIGGGGLLYASRLGAPGRLD